MPFKKILVPTDLSQYSLGALRYAESLADASGAELMVAHFRANGTGMRQASQQLADVLAARKRTLKTEAVVDVGDPLARILELAEARAVDLIVMGTQGRTGLRRALMGSVAENVVRHAPCSVMTLRYPEPGEPCVDPIRGPRPDLASILVPLDFSPLSFGALPATAALARAAGGVVHLLHVMEDGAPDDMVEAARETLQQAGASALQGAHFGPLIGYGDAGKTIVETAAEQRSDIIVMTTHGRTGLARLVMGSTAESVVRKAHCPVLTVRDRAAVAAPTAMLTK